MFIYVCYFVSVNLFLHIALQIEWFEKKIENQKPQAAAQNSTKSNRNIIDYYSVHKFCFKKFNFISRSTPIFSSEP